MRTNQEFYDEIARDYHTLRYSRAYHSRTAQMELDYLAPHLPSGAYLEVGPGTGRVTEFLLPRADSLLAVDLSAEMLKQLKDRLNRATHLRTQQADLGNLNSVPGYGQFDCCVSMRVLPHIPDLAQALSALARSVRPGGRVAFDLWNAWGVDGVGKRLKLRPSRVYTRYDTRRRMRREIEAAGLRVIAHRGFGYLPYRPFLLADHANLPVINAVAQRVLWVCEPLPDAVQ